jgi:hypothetical protein
MKNFQVVSYRFACTHAGINISIEFMGSVPLLMDFLYFFADQGY